MAIMILPPDVVGKIAAGEVVERPASTAKELIENSLDAGATDIRVEIREGGRRLLRVIDNGCGIPHAEVELAVARHATSKLRTADDLQHITTLGFRGEALNSIAAVSQMTILTRSASEETGAQVRLEGGQIVARESHGAPPGTIITVENLFFNMPARLAFLRQPQTEGGHIAEMIARYAQAFPERRFSLLADGRLVFQSTGSGALTDVLVKVHGLDVAREMIPVGVFGENRPPDDRHAQGEEQEEQHVAHEVDVGAQWRERQGQQWWVTRRRAPGARRPMAKSTASTASPCRQVSVSRSLPPR